MLKKEYHHKQTFTYETNESDIDLVLSYINSMNASEFQRLRNNEAKGSPKELVLDNGEKFYAGIIDASMRVTYDHDIFTQE